LSTPRVPLVVPPFDCLLIEGDVFRRQREAGSPPCLPWTLPPRSLLGALRLFVDIIHDAQSLSSSCASAFFISPIPLFAQNGMDSSRGFSSRNFFSRPSFGLGLRTGFQSPPTRLLPAVWSTAFQPWYSLPPVGRVFRRTFFLLSVPLLFAIPNTFSAVLFPFLDV